MKRANHISPGFKMFDSGKLKSVISSHMDFLFSTENIRHELDNMEEDFTFLADAQKAMNEKEVPADDRIVANQSFIDGYCSVTYEELVYETKNLSRRE